MRNRPGPPWYTPPQQRADGLTVASESLWWTYLPAASGQPEMLYLDGLCRADIYVDTSGFSGALSSADDTLQKALETLDAHPGVQGPAGPAGEGLYLPGGYNVGAGYSLLSRLDVGAEYNIAVGYEAGETITTGDWNIAIGYQAMYGAGLYSCTGVGNIAIGGETLARCGTGQYNIALGDRAGRYLTTSSVNICIGYAAGGRITTSVGGNVAIGRDALNGGGDVTGQHNIGIGYAALAPTAALKGDNNLAIGYGAGRGVTTGSSNIALGNGALDEGAVVGSGNVAIGLDAMNSASLTTAANSVAVGTNALASVTTSAYNVGVGGNAGNTITTGQYNVCLGVDSDASAAATAAVSIGCESGMTLGSYVGNAASYSVQIGYQTYCTQQAAVAIGKQAAATGQAGNIQLGTGTNSRTDASYYTLQVGGSAAYKCYAYSWVSTSDERQKENVADLTEAEGLGLILALRPISYEMKLSEYGKKNAEKNKGAKRKRDFGLSAQAVQAAMESLGLDPNEAVTADDENGWGIDYSRLIAPLIKAVQQLAAKVTKLEEELSKKG